MNLSIRNKRLLKWAGLPLLGLVTFVMAMHWTFPYDRLKGRIEQMAASKYNVSINSIEPTFFPGGVVLKTVVLESKPSKPDETPTKVVLDEIHVDIGLLALIGGSYNVDLVAKIAGGEIDAHIAMTKSNLKVKVSTASLTVANIPGVIDAVGLPMTGELNANFDLELPKHKWAKAKGKIKISCPECTVGDGKTLVKPKDRPGMSSYRKARRDAFIGDGVPVPKLSLGDFSGEIDIKDGVGTITRLAGKSRDGELIIEGPINFADPFKNSTMPACLKFKVSDELGKRDPKFANFPALMGVPPIDDGWSYVKAKGKLSSLRWLSTRGKVCVPGDAPPKTRTPRRPRVTTRGASRTTPPKPATPAPAVPGGTQPTEPAPAVVKPETDAPTTARKRALSELKPGGSGPALTEDVKGDKSATSRKRKDDVRAGDDDDDDDSNGKADDRRGDDDDDDDSARGQDGDKDADRDKNGDDEYDGR